MIAYFGIFQIQFPGFIYKPIRYKKIIFL